jgi:hypothetical protein
VAEVAKGVNTGSGAGITCAKTGIGATGGSGVTTGGGRGGADIGGCGALTSIVGSAT